MKLQYKRIYIDTLKEIRFKGIKIYHKKQACDTGGTYDPTTCIIEIDPKYRYTKEGVFYLLHEYGHYLDHREGRFVWFFNSSDKEKYSEAKMKEVFEAERSASKIALREAKLRGLKDCYAVELDEDEKDYLETFYRKHYFID